MEKKLDRFAIKENRVAGSKNRSMIRMKEIVERYLYTVSLGLITDSRLCWSGDQTKSWLSFRHHEQKPQAPCT